MNQPTSVHVLYETECDCSLEEQEKPVISRLYIDNYRCFVNFEWRPGMQSLLLGENGNGKTSVFEVLDLIRSAVVDGRHTSEGFPARTLTAWDQRAEQTFEVQIQGVGRTYDYRLLIEQHREKQTCRIRSERLTCDGVTLFEFDGKEVHLYRDDGSAGPVFPFDWSRSAIATVPVSPDNTKLIWFRDRINRILVFSPDPRGIAALSTREESSHDRSMHNLVSWLRHLQQESVDLLPRIRDSLRDALIGFADLKFEKAGETGRILKLEFEVEQPGETRRFIIAADWLSDGQRMLIALYSILHGVVAADTTICIDEPDNFVSLREIQPWLVELKDRSDDVGCQWLMISHHPEVMDYLAAERGSWFHRVGTGPVRVRAFDCDKEGLFKPSEIVAKGLVSE